MINTIFIRHGEKMYKNGKCKTFSLDPGLSEKGKCDSKNKFEDIILKYGLPKKIICSPFLRTRETAEIAKLVIECNSKENNSEEKIEIIFEPLVGEYLGNQIGKDIQTCLRKETLFYNPIPPETYKDYTKRVKKFNKKFKNLENTWIITHGIFLQSIAYLNKTKIKYPKELECIKININEISSI